MPITAQRILDTARHTGADAHFASTSRGETIRALSDDHDAIAVFRWSDTFDTWAVDIKRREAAEYGDAWTLVYRDLVLNSDDVTAAMLRLASIGGAS